MAVGGFSSDQLFFFCTSESKVMSTALLPGADESDGAPPSSLFLLRDNVVLGVLVEQLFLEAREIFLPVRDLVVEAVVAKPASPRDTVFFCACFSLFGVDVVSVVAA